MRETGEREEEEWCIEGVWRGGERRKYGGSRQEKAYRCMPK